MRHTPAVRRLLHLHLPSHSSFFFFNDTATTEIYTLSLHDALPISLVWYSRFPERTPPRRSIGRRPWSCCAATCAPDRKSTRLNSSHGYISYAVFCLKKKKRPVRRPSWLPKSDIHHRSRARPPTVEC